MQATPRGRLRVTSSVDFATKWFGRIIASFLDEHRDINIELEATDKVVDLIEDGFDLAIRFGPMPESTLIARRLCAVYLIACASPAYIAQRGAPRTIEELDEHDHVLFTPASRNQTWTLASGDQTHEFGRPARFASNNFGAVLTSALSGSGIALVSDFMVAEELAAGTLVRVLPDWTTRATDVHAVYPAREKLPPRLSLFLEHLAQALNPPPWVS
jgi:DNA-binding transcriptional LysR family regulator